jgi:hypothetical protein
MPFPAELGDLMRARAEAIGLGALELAEGA